MKNVSYYRIGGFLLPMALGVAMIISLVFHVGGFIYVYTHKGMPVLVSGDATVYVNLAKNLLNGNGFIYTSPTGEFLPELVRTPALPAIIAPFAGSDRGLAIYLYIWTILASLLIPYFTYRIGAKIFSERAGVIGGILMALEPQFAFSSWTPLTDTPFVLVGLVSVLFFLRAHDRKTLDRGIFIDVILSGLFAGYGVLLRPGNLILFIIVYGGVLLHGFFTRHKKETLVALLVLGVCFASIVPWMMRNHRIKGTYELTIPVWHQIYVNYVAAVSTIETGAEFTGERRKQKEKVAKALGREELTDVFSADDSQVIRNMVFDELMQHKKTVVKLEALLLVSYFTNDNYYNQLIRNGFLEPITQRISPTQVILKEGISGIPRILEEMRKQYFVPVISRLYQIAVLLLACVGLWRIPRKLSALFILLFALVAVISTTSGLGVEVRYRMPIMPILFLLVGYVLAQGLPGLGFFRKDVKNV